MSSMAVFIAFLHQRLHHQIGKPWTKPGTAHPL